MNGRLSEPAISDTSLLAAGLFIIPCLTSNVRLIAPAFAWAEVGSGLRKKS
jgi:hypothetical protein